MDELQHYYFGDWETMTSINQYDDDYDALPDCPISNDHLQTHNEQDDDDNTAGVNGMMMKMKMR